MAMDAVSVSIKTFKEREREISLHVFVNINPFTAMMSLENDQ